MAGYSGKQLRRISKGSVRAQVALRKRYHRTYARIFASVGRDVVAALRSTPIPQAAKGKVPKKVSKVLDQEKLEAKITKNTANINRAGIFLGGSFDRAIFDPTKTKTKWSKVSGAIKEKELEFGRTHHNAIAGTVRERYMRTIAQGIGAHETMDELILRAAKTTKGLTESHARMVAVTESTRMFSAGGQGFRDENGITDKQWVTAFVNSRPTHKAVHGKVIGNEKEFSVGADSMPFPGAGSSAKENANCSCVTVAAFEEALADPLAKMPVMEQDFAKLTKAEREKYRKWLEKEHGIPIALEKPRTFKHGFKDGSVREFTVLGEGSQLKIAKEMTEEWSRQTKKYPFLKKVPINGLNFNTGRCVELKVGAFYEPRTRGITIRSDKIYNKSNVAYRSMHQNKMLVGDSLRDVMVHESGHAADDYFYAFGLEKSKRAPKRAIQRRASAAVEFLQTDKRLIKKTVSKYAAAHEDECFAEMFNGMTTGRTYPAKFMPKMQALIKDLLK